MDGWVRLRLEGGWEGGKAREREEELGGGPNGIMSYHPTSEYKEEGREREKERREWGEGEA